MWEINSKERFDTDFDFDFEKKRYKKCDVM